MSFQEAANEASRLQNYMDTLERARKVLSAAAEAERAEQDILGRIAPARQELADLQEKIDERQSVLNMALSEVDAARSQAAEILAEASRQASVKATELDVMATKHKTEMAQREQAHKVTLATLAGQISDKQRELDRASRELEDTLKKIADAKAAAIAALA